MVKKYQKTSNLLLANRLTLIGLLFVILFGVAQLAQSINSSDPSNSRPDWVLSAIGVLGKFAWVPAIPLILYLFWVVARKVSYSRQKVSWDLPFGLRPNLGRLFDFGLFLTEFVFVLIFATFFIIFGIEWVDGFLQTNATWALPYSRSANPSFFVIVLGVIMAYYLLRGIKLGDQFFSIENRDESKPRKKFLEGKISKNQSSIANSYLKPKIILSVLTLLVVFQQMNIQDQQRQLMSPPLANLTIEPYNYENTWFFASLNLSSSGLIRSEGFQVPFVVVNTGQGNTGPIILDSKILIDGVTIEGLSTLGEKSTRQDLAASYLELGGVSSGRNTDKLSAVITPPFVPCTNCSQLTPGNHTITFQFKCLACKPQINQINVTICFLDASQENIKSTCV